MQESASNAVRVPRLSAGTDVTTLPLTAHEGFVLSRIDGRACVADISMMTGLPQPQLLSMLERLADLGAVVLPWRPSVEDTTVAEQNEAAEVAQGAQCTQGAGVAATVADEGAQAHRSGAAAALPLTPYDDPAEPPEFDPADLQHSAALDDRERRRIVFALRMIPDLTLYEQLGVEQYADRRAIRDAYFSMSKLFHPDAYFGQELGAYRAMMESVFKQLTETYEILSRKARRADYDNFLKASGLYRSAPPPPLAPLLPTGSDVASHQSETPARAKTPLPPPPPPSPRRPLEERRQLAAERMRHRFLSMPRPEGAISGTRPVVEAAVSRVSREDSVSYGAEPAVVALQRQLRESPLRAAAYLAQAADAANALLQRGDAGAARRVVEYILGQDPHHARALELAARLPTDGGRGNPRESTT